MISFPNFNLNFDFSPIAFGSVRWYGIIFAVAVLAGCSFALWRAYRAGENIDKICDCIFITLISAIIGARAYYVIFSGESYTFLEALKIWEGGIAIYGGIIGGAIALAVFCNFNKISFIKLADIFAPALLLAQGIGRWGNFTNREAFGGEYYGLFRMEIEKYGSKISVHPCFLYESVWNLAGVLLILLLEKFNKTRALTISFYIFWYGLGRAIIEPMRADSLMLGNLKISEIVAILTCILGLVSILCIIFRRNKNET